MRQMIECSYKESVRVLYGRVLMELIVSEYVQWLLKKRQGLGPKCHCGHAGRAHSVLVYVSAGGLAVQGLYHLSSCCLRLYFYSVTRRNLCKSSS